MNDILDKIAILKMLLRSAFDQWRNEIWEHDLDQPYCCDGRECGCGAMTLREVYSPSTTGGHNAD